jgi:hypothetical protein
MREDLLSHHDDREQVPARRSHQVGERAITSILNYALLLVIVTLLVAGLLVGVSGFVETQSERAVRSQLDTVGNQLAADIETASRLVGTAGGDQVSVDADLPDTVGGSHYRIEATNVSGDRYRLVLRSSKPAVETSVVVRSTVPVAGTAEGGRVSVAYDGNQNQLVVSDA